MEYEWNMQSCLNIAAMLFGNENYNLVQSQFHSEMPPSSFKELRRIFEYLRNGLLLTCLAFAVEIAFGFLSRMLKMAKNHVMQRALAAWAVSR